jgi:hypothetical protein
MAEKHIQSDHAVGLSIQLPKSFGQPNLVIRQDKDSKEVTVTASGPRSLVKQINLAFNGYYIMVQHTTEPNPVPPLLTWGLYNREFTIVSEKFNYGNALTVTPTLPAHACHQGRSIHLR